MNPEEAKALKVGSKGRITVPSKVRKELGVGEGDKVEVVFLGTK